MLGIDSSANIVAQPVPCDPKSNVVTAHTRVGRKSVCSGGTVGPGLAGSERGGLCATCWVRQRVSPLHDGEAAHSYADLSGLVDGC